VPRSFAKQRAGFVQIAVIAVIADIARHRCDRKTKKLMLMPLITLIFQWIRIQSQTVRRRAEAKAETVRIRVFSVNACYRQ
jgi:hypothetical protein